MKITSHYFLEEKLKMLEHMHTGVNPVSVNTNYDTDDILMKLIDILYEMQGHNKFEINEAPKLSEGYAWGEEESSEAKPDKFAFMKDLKGRKK